jgi:ABC-2 type transport system ATP-binding protein
VSERGEPTGDVTGDHADATAGDPGHGTVMNIELPSAAEPGRNPEPERPGPGTGVELRGVTKSYRTAGTVVHAVRGIDVSIDLGETVALLGPNGAGKSTTIDMLLGLSRPDGGTVSLLGGSPADAVAAGRVGAMLQSGALIRDVTPRELLELMAALHPAPLPVSEALELVGLTEIADRRTHKLSGGQAQRVRFAMALVSDPAVLILDEPTVGMDVDARRGFWASVRAFAARGKTVIFATHYLEEADAFADRAVLMAHGRVVADGATSEIRARVGRRTIRATVPGAERATLFAMPGVTSAELRGDEIVLICADSDAAIRALLDVYPRARDIEIAGAGLEDAFVQLTADADGDSETTTTELPEALV